MRTEPATRMFWDHLWGALFFEITVLEHALPPDVFNRARREVSVILEYEGVGARSHLPAQIVSRSAARSLVGPSMLERWRGDQAVILFGPQAYLAEYSKGPLVLLRQIITWRLNQANSNERATIERTYQNTLRGNLYRESDEAQLTRKSLNDFFSESSIRYLFVNPQFPSSRRELRQYDLATYCMLAKFWSKAAETDCA